MKPLVLIVAWFGAWPAWINVHLETCRANPEVDWLIVTDQEAPESRPKNVHFLRLSIAECVARIEGVIGRRIELPEGAYKFNDFKPVLAATFADEISGYRNFGYADIDIFYGNIRYFYTDDLLSKFDVISTHRERLCGHLAVFRNSRRMREAYRRMPRWKLVLTSSRFFGADEKYFTRLFRPRGPVGWLARRVRYRTLFVEQFSTVGKPIPWHDGTSVSPEHWRWRDGTLTTLHDGPGREFLYVHFMIWQSSRWRKDGTPAPWPLIEGGPVKIDWRTIAERGFDATPAGVLPIGA